MLVAPLRASCVEVVSHRLMMAGWIENTTPLLKHRCFLRDFWEFNAGSKQLIASIIFFLFCVDRWNVMEEQFSCLTNLIRSSMEGIVHSLL